MNFHIIFLMILVVSCSRQSNFIVPDQENEKTFIRGVDLSSLPLVESKNIAFYNFRGQKEDVLTTLKNNGVNTIRLRLWNNPVNDHSSFQEVKSFSQRIKSMGLKVWLSVHYSDTWADPRHQIPPLSWQGISFEALKDSVYFYTTKIIREIQPDYIQIGNEINLGLLLPYGSINTNEVQYLELISTGVQAVREHANETKIILHFAGINGSEWFFYKLANIDYDIIGLSYYPVWHGKKLDELKLSFSDLSQTFGKDILIAETSYPFTLEWRDWTDNIVGLEDQLILPDYPATVLGQKQFIAKIKEIIKSTKNGIGFCYWGGELVIFNGPEAKDGSPWENQALYDFENRALPVITNFKNE